MIQIELLVSARNVTELLHGLFSQALYGIDPEVIHRKIDLHIRIITVSAIKNRTTA